MLVLRQCAGVDFIDAELFGHGAGSSLAVAGQHDDAQAGFVQDAHGLGGGFLDGVGDRDQSGDATVDGGKHDGFALAATLFGCMGQGACIDAAVRHQPGIADQDRLTGDRAAHPLAGDGLEVDRLRQRNAALAGAVDERSGQRMFAGLLQRGHPAE